MSVHLTVVSRFLFSRTPRPEIFCIQIIIILMIWCIFPSLIGIARISPVYGHDNGFPRLRSVACSPDRHVQNDNYYESSENECPISEQKLWDPAQSYLSFTRLKSNGESSQKKKKNWITYYDTKKNFLEFIQFSYFFFLSFAIGKALNNTRRITSLKIYPLDPISNEILC